MGWLLMVVVFLTVGLCVAEDGAQRRRFLGGVVALLYLPIGILLELVKKCR